jgi:hypothetical protein
LSHFFILTLFLIGLVIMSAIIFVVAIFQLASYVVLYIFKKERADVWW